METCDEPIFPLFEDESLSFQQASPASQPPLPGSAEASAMTAGSGRQCAMWLNVSSRLGVFSKILMESLHWTASEEYCYVWERLDTRFGLSAFQLTPLEPSTDGTEYLLLGSVMTSEGGRNAHTEGIKQTLGRLWQTPVADDSVDRKNGKHNSRGEPKLSAQVKLWRTPNGSDMTGGPMNGERRLAQGHQLNLTEQAASPKLWPTPTLRDHKDGTSGNGRTDILGQAVNPSPSQGSLNPRFVEELMGFPIDHTVLRR